MVVVHIPVKKFSCKLSFQPKNSSSLLPYLWLGMNSSSLWKNYLHAFGDFLLNQEKQICSSLQFFQSKQKWLNSKRPHCIYVVVFADMLLTKFWQLTKAPFYLCISVVQSLSLYVHTFLCWSFSTLKFFSIEISLHRASTHICTTTLERLVGLMF